MEQIADPELRRLASVNPCSGDGAGRRDREVVCGESLSSRDRRDSLGAFGRSRRGARRSLVALIDRAGSARESGPGHRSEPLSVVSIQPGSPARERSSRLVGGAGFAPLVLDRRYPSTRDSGPRVSRSRVDRCCDLVARSWRHRLGLERAHSGGTCGALGRLLVATREGVRVSPGAVGVLRRAHPAARGFAAPARIRLVVGAGRRRSGHVRVSRRGQPHSVRRSGDNVRRRTRHRASVDARRDIFVGADPGNATVARDVPRQLQGHAACGGPDARHGRADPERFPDVSP